MRKKKICGVYKITNLVNGKFYIGSSNNIEHRWKEHISDLSNGVHINSYLQNAWNKYGSNNFKFEILEECEENVQFQKEQEYLDKLSPFDTRGYNLVRKISNDLIGGTTISLKCKKCGKDFESFSHLSQYCEACKKEMEDEATAQWKNNRRTYISDRKSYDQFCREMTSVYGSMDYYWECNC